MPGDDRGARGSGHGTSGRVAGAERKRAAAHAGEDDEIDAARRHPQPRHGDRKSTRLNSSHGYISYAVFCLKKKKKKRKPSSSASRPQSRGRVSTLKTRR